MTNAEQTIQTSGYLEYLPAIFQDGAPFLRSFLLAFETVLSGVRARDPRGLEATLDRLYTFFDSEQTPEEFLPWLASWVALTLQPEWDIGFRRRFIGQITSLYRQRGTRAGVEALLRAYVDVTQLQDSDKSVV